MSSDAESSSAKQRRGTMLIMKPMLGMKFFVMFGQIPGNQRQRQTIVDSAPTSRSHDCAEERGHDQVALPVVDELGQVIRRGGWSSRSQLGPWLGIRAAVIHEEDIRVTRKNSSSKGA